MGHLTITETIGTAIEVQTNVTKLTIQDYSLPAATYYDEIYTSGSLVTPRKKTNFGSGFTVADDPTNEWTNIVATGGTSSGSGGVGANMIFNGGFPVSQRGTTFTAASTPANSDDTVLLDHWVLLSDGNDIVDVSQSTEAPAGFSHSIKLEVETANKQFGLCQFLENVDTAAIISGSASLSFYARMGASDDNTHSLKAVAIAWDGTADALTSDVVDTWDPEPTLVANWTAENTAASNTLTDLWQKFTIENIAIDTADAKNVGVFIFCDQVDGAIDDVIYITGVKLEKGTACTDFVARPYAEELKLCQRYFEVMGGALYAIYVAYYQAASAGIATTCYLKVTKFKTPVITIKGTWSFANCTGLGAYGANVNSFALAATATNSASTVIATDSADDLVWIEAEF